MDIKTYTAIFGSLKHHQTLSGLKAQQKNNGGSFCMQRSISSIWMEFPPGVGPDSGDLLRPLPLGPGSSRRSRLNIFGCGCLFQWAEPNVAAWDTLDGLVSKFWRFHDIPVIDGQFQGENDDQPSTTWFFADIISNGPSKTGPSTKWESLYSSMATCMALFWQSRLLYPDTCLSLDQVYPLAI